LPNGLVKSSRQILAPVADESALEVDPGTNFAVFGGSPDRPETTHWEAELWSENPGTPPSAVTPDDPAIRAGDDEISHRDLLAVAADLVVDYGMDGDTRLVVRETFTGVEAVAAGVIAPLSCGGTVVLDRSGRPGKRRHRDRPGTRGWMSPSRDGSFSPRCVPDRTRNTGRRP